MFFDGGFKPANSSRELLDIIPKVERVHIMEFATPVDAYVRAYNEYQARSGGATIPDYEEMLADVLERLPFAEVVEAVNIADAVAIIAYWYMCRHLSACAELLTEKALRYQRALLVNRKAGAFMFGIIYVITNRINGKNYVEQTTRTLEQ